MSIARLHDERFARRVGALTLALIGAAVGFFVVVYPRIEWREPVRARVYFHDVGGLREGAAFVVAGRQVGRVESVVPVMRGAAEPLGGEPGIVVTIAIDAEVARRVAVRPWPWVAPDARHPPADVFVASRGIVSERYLELAPTPGGGVPLRDGAELLGSDPATLDRVLQRTLASIAAMRSFAEQVRPEFDALRVQLRCLRAHFDQPELGRLFVEASALSGELDQLRNVSLGGDRGLAHAGAVIDEARAVIAELRTTLDALAPSVRALRARIGTAGDRIGTRGAELVARLDDAIGTLHVAFAKSDAVLAQVDTVRARLARGEGSLMKLTEDPEFPEDMKELGKVLKRQPWKLLETPVD